MSNVVIAGASGVVGSRVLRGLLARPDVDHVVALGRRPLPVEHEKLVSTTADLQDPHDIASRIPDGTTIRLTKSSSVLPHIFHALMPSAAVQPVCT